jgi:Lrp/AsnC family leucine-responsive transcriptional regulator
MQTGPSLAEIPEIQEVYNVAGEDCYLIKVRTRDTQTLGRLLRDKVGAIKSVVSTRTTIVMESYKESLKLPMEYAQPSRKR